MERSNDFPTIPAIQCADHPCRNTCLQQDFFNDKCGCGFAVRAGNANNFQLFGRIAIKLAGQGRKGFSAVFNFNIPDIQGNGFLADDRCRTPDYSAVNIFMTIDFESGNRNKQSPGLNLTGIEMKRTDFRIRIQTESARHMGMETGAGSEVSVIPRTCCGIMDSSNLESFTLCPLFPAKP